MIVVKQVLRYYVCATLMIFVLCEPTLDCQNSDSICPSFEAVTRNQFSSEWTKLDVTNDGQAELSQIPRDTFENYTNVVELQIKNLANGIQRGAFNGLHKLNTLHLFDNKLQVIASRTFENLLVSIISVYDCEVEEISPRAFEKLPNLSVVHFYGNNIDTIAEGIFSGTRISELYLKSNHIKFIEANAFSAMPLLVILNLGDNELTSFKPQLAIGFSPSLERLYYNKNNVRKATRDMFRMMPNLKALVFNSNNVDKLDSRVFYDLPNVDLLDISNNNIKVFPINALHPAGNKKMRYLFMHDNKMTFLSTTILDLYPNLQYLSAGGNPWQCPCWKRIDDYLRIKGIAKICYDDYIAGNRPFCIIPEVNPDKCVTDVNMVSDILKIYDGVIEEYGKLPPICNIKGVSKPKLDYYNY